MHPVLMTLVALGINSGDGPVQAPKAPVPHVCETGCDTCGPVGHGHGHWAAHRAVKKALHAQHQMMPQTCYEPTFGCYTGSRFMHRYPAFHGSYYRRPYNYRNVFDYPWHAELHEPTSLFSYNVEAPAASPTPAGGENLPVRTIQPSTTTRRMEREEQPVRTSPIGTGVKPGNPFRSASVSMTDDSSSEPSDSASSRRKTRRGAISTPRLRR